MKYLRGGGVGLITHSTFNNWLNILLNEDLGIWSWNTDLKGKSKIMKIILCHNVRVL